ncbi:Snf7-domain-containing protein [Macrophomina phaseolina]|uniref:Snf7-domain-containing protein n=1 Tax=Macrophomina phaseolina TaxID=35725 RepID=A0ABQ8GS66_9PEZI|nr:Snf7-domain-containing protein [Macrophomina phaseolina]
MSELLEFILTHEDAFKRGRLASLYSDFRIQQANNPDGYNANITAWRQALTDAARAGLVPSQTGAYNLLTLGTGEALLRELTSKDFGRPLALAAVIHDAVSKKEMIPLKDFVAAKTSIYSRSWSINPLSILSWGLQQLGVIGGTVSQDKLVAGEFVIVANLEAASNAILSQASSRTSIVDRIYSLDSFTTAFSHVLSPVHALTTTDISLVLTHLSRDKAALSYDATSQTIKLAPPNTTTPDPITQQDITIAHLRSLIASLTTQLPLLSARIASCEAAARAAVATKSRTAALAALRSKKLAEQGLQRRADTLAQLETVYAKIEEAADNVEVVRAMEASAGVLRGLHEQVGGAEGVESVVEALREEMGKADEVNDVINEVGRESSAAVDEDEVDEEFAELERAEREKVEREEAERTAERLRELERLEEERKRAERATEQKKRTKEVETSSHAADEAQVLETSQELGRMSLDEESRPTLSSEEQNKAPKQMQRVLEE